MRRLRFRRPFLARVGLYSVLAAVLLPVALVAVPELGGDCACRERGPRLFAVDLPMDEVERRLTTRGDELLELLDQQRRLAHDLAEHTVGHARWALGTQLPEPHVEYTLRTPTEAERALSETTRRLWTVESPGGSTVRLTCREDEAERTYVYAQSASYLDKRLVAAAAQALLTD